MIDVGSEDAPALVARVYSDDAREVVAFARATVDGYTRAGMLADTGRDHPPGERAITCAALR